ncbi:MAG TPA: serine/threonine-protein kinase [Planctomycetota bacterium]|nr:serine/threonine-protein kinase [Planctomycetota bacterium]
MQDDLAFGAIAVREGFLTQNQLDEILARRDGPPLADELLERRLLTPEQVQAIRDILRVHAADLGAPGESGGILQHDRFLLPCTRCDTYHLILGLPDGTRFVCRKCRAVLTVQRPAPPPTSAPAPRASDLPRVGPYRLLQEIGRGAMSTVYKAVHADTGRTVALKILRASDGSTGASSLARFRQEARAARRLSHPSIVAVHEAGEENGASYIVMDYVEGKTLDRALAEGNLTLRAFVTVLEQVARAVHHAHQYGIVHRDLKPANILLDASGAPHVTDFGLAKMDHMERSATRAGSSLGTPYYMSPEQVEGDVTGTDARSDIYALGVMLYQALTGRVPYPGSSVLEVYRGVLSGRLTPPSQLNPDAPPELEAVCLKALQRDKTRRHPSAREFADDLRRWLDRTADPCRNPKTT